MVMRRHHREAPPCLACLDAEPTCSSCLTTPERHQPSQGSRLTQPKSQSPFCSHRPCTILPVTSPPSRPPSFTLAHCAPAKWGTSVLLKHTRCALSSGPLHRLLPLPGTLLPQTPTWPAPHHAGLCSHVTTSEACLGHCHLYLKQHLSPGCISSQPRHLSPYWWTPRLASVPIPSECQLGACLFQPSPILQPLGQCLGHSRHSKISGGQEGMCDSV